MHLSHYLGLIHAAERELATSYRAVGRSHPEESDIVHLTERLAGQCDDHVRQLEPFAERYRETSAEEPERLQSSLFSGTRSGGLGLLRDLHDLYLMACECDITWTMIGQAAQGARDRELLSVVHSCESETASQMKWLRTRMKQAAPQALVVAA